jgi:Zn-finger nucleic acid-binding protein
MRDRLVNFPEVGEESPIACPRCGGLMRLRHEGDVEVDFCTQCKGVWLDLGEDEALRYKADWDRHTETEEHVRAPAIIAVLGDEFI